MTQIIIAIDPDLKKSGVVKIIDGEIIDLASLDICVLIEYVKQQYTNSHYLDDLYFVVEDVTKIKTIYSRNRKQNTAVAGKIAQNVGMCKAVGLMIGELIEGITGKKPELAPVGIGKQTKNDAKLFNELTGWKGKSNEDTRDAAAIGLWLHEKLKKEIKKDQLVVPPW